MLVSASDFYSYFQPSKCDLRIHLRYQKLPESPPSPYEEILKLLGERHEKEHLAGLGPYKDISTGSFEDRLQRTRNEISQKTPIIYQPVFKAVKTIAGKEVEIIGSPDFLLYDMDRFLIRDAKIARRITEKDHSEILCQIQLYGWLFEHTINEIPGKLQIYSGDGEIRDFTYNGGDQAFKILNEIVSIKSLSSEPYAPVGWSKCNGCGFCERCWSSAEERHDIALVYGVDQGLAMSLHNMGIDSIESFLSAFDEKTLGEFKRPWGKSERRIGKSSSSILKSAQAILERKEYILNSPEIPDYPNYVMFDLESLPPHLNELEKIYLWGMQVFGDEPSEYMAATAGFGPEGDQQGWSDFLKKAKYIFDKYSDLPFVHWHSYEKTHLNKYIERFGNPDGIADRVRKNLFDLLKITQKSLVLPLPSYSLKVVEKYIGFERTQEEYGGDWAMAKYIEATELQDEKLRSEVLDQILSYNKEDLEATWMVLKWLKSK
jgi:predicted RecB family nuclease